MNEIYRALIRISTRNGWDVTIKKKILVLIKCKALENF